MVCEFILGRRGSGKTEALRILGSDGAKRKSSFSTAGAGHVFA